MTREGGVGSYIRGVTPVARGGGDRPPCRARGLGPVVARGGGDMPLFFRDLVANLKKKLHLGLVALWGATGGILKIFQNGHIFLKFLFLKIYIKKKRSVLHDAELGWIRTKWGCWPFSRRDWPAASRRVRSLG